MKDLTERPGYNIRYTEFADEKHLRRWLFMPGILSDFPVADKTEAEPLIKNWIGFSKFKCSLTATWQEQPIGIATLFLMPYRKVAHHALLYFLVSPDYQDCGVGTSIVKNIKHLAKNYFKLESLHLDIYEGSKAHALLREQGFVDLTRQEDFVHEEKGVRARYLMECRL